MFWLGLSIALVGGLLGIEVCRKKIKRHLTISDHRLDLVALVCLLGGLCVSGFEQIQTESELSALREETSPRHLSPEQRRAMSPVLEKLRGRVVAFAYRMMDGESGDYCSEISGFFREYGCEIPRLIPTSTNDFKGYVAITARGQTDNEIVEALLSAFKAGKISAKVEETKSNSLGFWYDNTVHVIVGRKK